MRKERRGRILIVDDNKPICHLLNDFFTEEGFISMYIHEGEGALEILRDQDIDIVLLDILLPGIDGIEILRRMRSEGVDSDVIMISSHATVANSLEAMHLGAYDFLPKPFDLEDSLRVIKKAMERRQLIKENDRLNNTLKSKVKRLSILNDLGQAMHSIHDREELFNFFVELVGDVLNVERVSLMLLDKKTGKMLIKASVGIDEDVISRVRIGPGEGVAGRALKEGRALRLEDLKNQEDFSPKDKRGYSSDSFISVPVELSVPIRSKREIMGVINVSNHKLGSSFSEEDVDFLSTLAANAAHALDNAMIFEELVTVNRQLKKTHLETMMALADALEAKDSHTRGHSDRTVEYAMEIAFKMKLTELEKENLKYAAILHDVGKIGIPESILNKPAKLTDDEYELIKTHPVIGSEIIFNISFLKAIAPLVKSHHERYDGKGYPNGLKGDDIPIESRIVSVLDAYDAMTSDRPYRKSQGKEWAMEELRRFAGTQFDPNVVESFISILGDLDSENEMPDNEDDARLLAEG